MHCHFVLLFKFRFVLFICLNYTRKEQVESQRSIIAVWLINRHNLEQMCNIDLFITTVCKVKVGQDNVKQMFLIILMGMNEQNISTQEIRFRNFK